MAIDAIVVNEKDNVATALQDLAAGLEARTLHGHEVRTFPIQEPIPYGHKFATAPLAPKDKIVKYGEIIGEATAKIEVGCHVHVQNVVSLRGRGDIP
jgi:altronate dehydratase small subunit